MTCYRNPSLHSACTETFFKRELELESKSDVSSEREKAEKRRERQKMVEILHRLEEERDSDDIVLQEELQGTSGEGSYEYALSARLETLGIAVDDASPEAIWDLLTPDERNSFIKAIKDPDAAAELSKQADKGFENDVWWKFSSLDEDQDPKIPKMIEIPVSLIPLSMDPSHPRPSIIYNLVAIW